jgi:hypothetical protein
MNSHINKPRSLEDDKELFERFKPGLEWKDENLVNKCAGCSSKFTIVKRKHHCRECGDVFCNSCSLHKNVIQGVLKRCCTSCYHRTVAESKHSMIGNHLDMDYDDNIAVGDGSVSSYRSASFAKAVHIVDSMQSPARGKKGKAAASTTSQQQPPNPKEGGGSPGKPKAACRRGWRLSCTSPRRATRKTSKTRRKREAEGVLSGVVLCIHQRPFLATSSRTSPRLLCPTLAVNVKQE